jgi:hypothetical protein
VESTHNRGSPSVILATQGTGNARELAADLLKGSQLGNHHPGSKTEPFIPLCGSLYLNLKTRIFDSKRCLFSKGLLGKIEKELQGMRLRQIRSGLFELRKHPFVRVTLFRATERFENVR